MNAYLKLDNSNNRIINNNKWKHAFEKWTGQINFTDKSTNLKFRFAYITDINQQSKNQLIQPSLWIGPTWKITFCYLLGFKLGTSNVKMELKHAPTINWYAICIKCILQYNKCERYNYSLSNMISCGFYQNKFYTNLNCDIVFKCNGGT